MQRYKHILDNRSRTAVDYLRRSLPEADTTEQEAEIDRLVYGLYGLTEEEVAAVEGGR